MTIKLYTQDQVKRACQRAGEYLYWQYYESGWFPDAEELTKEVLDNLTDLEELEPVTEVHISHDITCKCDGCCS